MAFPNRRRRTEGGDGWDDAEPNVYRVQAWGGFAENIVESCGKGDRVHVTGSIVTDRWTDKETGEDRIAQHVKADEVAFSLRYHTVRATKATRASEASDGSHLTCRICGQTDVENGGAHAEEIGHWPKAVVA